MSWTQTIDWAATALWAQAFLSAGAVFASVWLQDRSFEKRGAAARVAHRTTAMALILMCGRTLRSTARALEGANRSGLLINGGAEHAVLEARAVLASFPIAQVATPDDVVGIAEVRTLMTHAADYLDRARGRLTEEAASPPNQERIFAALIMSLDKMGPLIDEQAQGIATRHGLALPQIRAERLGDVEVA